MQTVMSALGHKRTSGRRPVGKEAGRQLRRPTTYSVRRVQPFRATAERFLHRPDVRQNRSISALARRLLPPYGGILLNLATSFLRQHEQNRPSYSLRANSRQLRAYTVFVVNS